MNRHYTNKILGIIVSILLTACCSVPTTLSSAMKGIKVLKKPFVLCEQYLTSAEYLEKLDSEKIAVNSGEVGFGKEITPVRDIFFWPDENINPSEIVEIVRSRYNQMAVSHHVQHSYELFKRKASMVELKTRQDTLGIIAEDRMILSQTLLEEVFPDKEERAKANSFLAAYSNYDGTDSSPFWKEQNNYVNGVGDLDQLATIPLLDDFAEHFWSWYDKRVYVPEIDSIAVVYLSENSSYSEKDLARFRSAIEGEKEINRRTILALEYLRIEGIKALDSTAVQYLGEILESGLYTKYLLEAWVAWRAAVQVNYFGMSTYSFIPNRYYDKVRVKVMNTILRHMQESPDKYDGCLLVNLMACGPLQRMYYAYGNESGITIRRLTQETFILPSALGYDYLNKGNTH